jgi:bacillithiol biosynthesis deacetylase BshB1
MAEKAGKSFDYMAIGAHPDDIELGCGGTLLRLASLGKRGVLVDMTDASMGTRGTPEIRAREAGAAAKLLKAERVNLGLPDGRLADGWEAQKRLIDQIRIYRPKVLITHHWREEHPDHEQTAQIVKQAAYKAGLAKLDVAGRPHCPGRIFHFVGMEAHEPSFCVDITPFWEAKLKAILCYRSQFHNPAAGEFRGKTDLASPAFLEFLAVRNRFWGQRIKRRYAEAFVCNELPEVDDLTALGGERFA